MSRIEKLIEINKAAKKIILIAEQYEKELDDIARNCDKTDVESQNNNRVRLASVREKTEMYIEDTKKLTKKLKRMK